MGGNVALGCGTPFVGDVLVGVGVPLEDMVGLGGPLARSSPDANSSEADFGTVLLLL